MEVSALNFPGGVGLHGRSPLLRLQSDERLVALVRRGSASAFEVLVARYEQRLLAFCRHLLGSREDAEDVLQEVMAAAYHALVTDERSVNVRPWLYRIARNRCLNQLRRPRPSSVDLIDIQFSDFGATAADKAHEREEFRALVEDIQQLPETQRTALVLREMEALSYDQIAEAMETTVPGIKSLLVRARVSLAEAAEARQISCDEVREELGEIAEGLRRRSTPPVRRHLAGCQRCASFRKQLRHTNRALAALLPLGPFVVLRRLVFTQFGHHAGSGAAAAGSTAAGSTAAGASATAGGSLLGGSSVSGLISAGLGTVATKAAVGLAAAALVTVAGVEVDHLQSSGTGHTDYRAAAVPSGGSPGARSAGGLSGPRAAAVSSSLRAPSSSAPRGLPSSRGEKASSALSTSSTATSAATTASTTAPAVTTTVTTTPAADVVPAATVTTPASGTTPAASQPAGVTQTETIPTVLIQSGGSGNGAATSGSGSGSGTSTSGSGTSTSGSGTTTSGSGTSTSGSGTTTSGSGTTSAPPPPPPWQRPPPPPPWEQTPPPPWQPPPPIDGRG